MSNRNSQLNWIKFALLATTFLPGLTYASTPSSYPTIEELTRIFVHDAIKTKKSYSDAAIAEEHFKALLCPPDPNYVAQLLSLNPSNDYPNGPLGERNSRYFIEKIFHHLPPKKQERVLEYIRETGKERVQEIKLSNSGFNQQRPLEELQKILALYSNL